MKHFFSIIFVSFMVSGYAASTVESLTVDGMERSYIIYKPTSFDASKEYTTLMFLHPLGMSAEEFSQVSNPQEISDKNDALVVYPQAMDEQDKEMTEAINLISGQGIESAELAVLTTKSVWGAGARIHLSSFTDLIPSNMASFIGMLFPNISKNGYAELNKDVDDVKFINEVISDIQSNHNANNTIYMAGASLGGAMTYKYAFSEGKKVSKIGVVHGFVGEGVDTANVKLDIPVCVFHSQADSVIKYNGGTFNGSILETVESIASKNGCQKGTSEMLEDSKNDGNTVSLTTYPSDNNKTVYLYLSDNVAHSQMLNGKENDIDYITRLEQFFFFKDNTAVDDIQSPVAIAIYPNPASDYISCEENGSFKIINLMGTTVLSGDTNEGKVNISTLPSGSYMFQLDNKGKVSTAHFIKR